MNKISIISFTDKGEILGKKIAQKLNCKGQRLSKTGLNLRKWTEENFSKDALVFIGAVGIAVRAIAPFLKSKSSDPAVVVIDELGHFVIPILSGHIGGANNLALHIAEQINAAPVITTATDINGVFSIDSWAVREGMKVEKPHRIKDVSQKLLNNESVTYSTDLHKIPDLPDEICLNASTADFHIGYKKVGDILTLVPRCLTVGIGCKKGTSSAEILYFLRHVFDENKLYISAIKSLNSIDIKRNEEGLIEAASSLNIPVNFYTVEQLNSLEGEFSSSEFVMKTVNVDCVCERSACMNGGTLLIKKQTGNGITVAVAYNE